MAYASLERCWMKAPAILPLKMKDGAISQGMQVPSNSWEKIKQQRYPRASKKEFSLSDTLFYNIKKI